MARDHETPGGPPFHGSIVKGWGIACGSKRENVQPATNHVISTEGAQRRSGETPVFVFASRYPSSSGLSQKTSGASFPKLLLAIAILPLAGCHHKPPQVAHQAPPPISRRTSTQPATVTPRLAPPAPPTTTPAARPSTPRPESPAGTAPTTTTAMPPTAPSTTRTA